jgi:hypothetical protein
MVGQATSAWAAMGSASPVSTRFHAASQKKPPPMIP